MTNEQAISHFKEQLEIFGGEHHEAMKVAIEAWNKRSCIDDIVEQLEGLPNVNSDYWNFSDLIDRDDALEIVKGVQND